MIYVGHEGTNTSSHFDICGSIGHNLMVHAEVLGQADFPVHVFEQRLGDFVMVFILFLCWDLLLGP
ncbi:hypothetical protein DSO57_1003900 [Entomophthora muscae]|uniref:Uncharacterized protein n=1 Tax=Entomophthora muscae TaxID=34485 RepID=A0ACC2SA65_9FUNG|nr:hypothetical protein DSO57_1003900 [Entomophthora muscae]